MGLMIHSLGELPLEAQRGYYIYLLDYGWREPLGDVLHHNFDRMAGLASRHNAVVLKGTVGSHFEDEVLSWHHVNGQSAQELLPAIMITTRHPSQFREIGQAWSKTQDRLLLIPLRKVCRTAGEVIKLIEKLFSDIAQGKSLTDFAIAREIKEGKAGAVLDALILQPNVAGLGININRIIDFFLGKKRSSLDRK